ncbi:MAG: hypothetical protein CSA72_13815 [Rhodobacterales bacterium]|nr:MAG: hypothetical protein CSA72_13815 [Rhodobacterales bacterium]
MTRLTFTALTLACTLAASAQAQELFIAGVEPSQRPEGAPEITQVAKDGVWYQQALTGVSQPYPASLKFLEDQGNWFNPFIHPGMTGPYDIRGWHKQP